MPPPASIVVIVNARAGTATEHIDTELTNLFRASGRDVEIVVLRDGQSPTDAARSASARASIVVAAGGDGTVSGVVAGILDSPATLGVLPLGTLNHFARDLRIPFNLPKAVAVVAAGHIGHVDVGQVNDHVFVNNSSIGIYPGIVEVRSASRAASYTAYRGVTVSVVDGPAAHGERPVFVGTTIRHRRIRLGARSLMKASCSSISYRARAPSPGAPGESAARPRQAIREFEIVPATELWIDVRGSVACGRLRRRGDEDEIAVHYRPFENVAGRVSGLIGCGPSCTCPTFISRVDAQLVGRSSDHSTIAPNLVAIRHHAASPASSSGGARAFSMSLLAAVSSFL
jgi:hypothetical protein